MGLSERRPCSFVDADRKRRAWRRAAGTRAPILVEAAANARWSLDFVYDQFVCGRRFLILNIVG
jgi:putative transposase